MPLPETGTRGWVLPGLILQLKGEPGTGCPLNLRWIKVIQSLVIVIVIKALYWKNMVVVTKTRHFT